MIEKKSQSSKWTTNLFGIPIQQEALSITKTDWMTKQYNLVGTKLPLDLKDIANGKYMELEHEQIYHLGCFDYH